MNNVLIWEWEGERELPFCHLSSMGSQALTHPQIQSKPHAPDLAQADEWESLPWIFFFIIIKNNEILLNLMKSGWWLITILPLQGLVPLKNDAHTVENWTKKWRNADTRWTLFESLDWALSETSLIPGFFHDLNPHVLSPSQLVSIQFLLLLTKNPEWGHG